MRVFILDDEPTMLDIIAINFQLSGWEAETSTYDYDPPSGFDAYLIDVGLPRESGIDIARRLITRSPDSTVILFSAYDRDHIETWGGGEFLFISKMTSVQSIPELVEMCVNHERELRGAR